MFFEIFEIHTYLKEYKFHDFSVLSKFPSSLVASTCMPGGFQLEASGQHVTS